MTEPAVRLEGVTVRFGSRTALDNVTFAVRPGSIVGVLGPNGAGKTTLLSLVTGLRRPSAGVVTVLGRRLPVRGGELRRLIGVVLQETALYDELTAAENLRFSARLFGVPHSEARIAAVLDLLHLAGRADDRVGTLSAGLRRRTAIARALIHEPHLLVIDEPTLGVDAETRHAIWSHLRLLRVQGATIVVATNYLDEAQALCDTVAVLRAGRLIAYESPDSLVARAGRVLDIEGAAGGAVAEALRGVPGVLRVESTDAGTEVFLDGNADTDGVIRAVLGAGTVAGLRVRAADLAEVFGALREGGTGVNG